MPVPPPPTALVLGEALLDVVTEGGTTRTTPGGSPLNIAVGLARLGIAVTLATQFGQDEHGRAIAAHLAQNAVTVDRAAGGTSVARATLDADGSARYDFDIHWDRQAPVLHHAPALQHAPTLAHTGSIAAFLTPGSTAATDLFEQMPASTVRSLDPNIRPALLDHEQALARFERLARRAHIVKLSAEDAHWLFPGATVQQVLTRLLDAGAAVAAITRGAAGSVLASTQAVVEVAAPAVQVVDTIGAGDAYMSGLLFAALHASILPLLRQGTVDEQALRHLGTVGAASAAVAVSHPGAHPPTLHELVATTAAGGTSTA